MLLDVPRAHKVPATGGIYSGCCTVAVQRSDSSGTRYSLSAFYLQNRTFSEWTRGDSNPWPPPCEGGALPTELRAREASAILAAASRNARQEAKVVVMLRRW
jgi:hypothetical protein